MTRRNNPLIFLFGPTGVGKTELLGNVFSSGYSVVNADSKQVYRHLDIGSAKPDTVLRSIIPHYLVDIRDPWEQFSVGDFVHLSDCACEEIVKEGRIPIICGGTAYYFKHFYFGLPESPKSDPEIRKQVAQLAEVHGLSWLYERLCEIDPISGKKIHPSDGYRITRALEVFEATGRPLSTFHVPSTAREGIHPLVIGLTRPKEELDERIAQRVHHMFSQGLEDEVAHVVSLGANSSWPGMQGIGYREFFMAKEDPHMAKEDIRHMIIRNSRMYAKRQMTFFRHLPHVHWVHPDDTENLSSLVQSYLMEQL